MNRVLMPEVNVIIYVIDSARYDDFMDVYARFEHPLKKDSVAFPNADSLGTWTKPASSSVVFGLPARVTGMRVCNDAMPGIGKELVHCMKRGRESSKTKSVAILTQLPNPTSSD